MTTKKSEKDCTCCGGEAGQWAQWWNQDTGYTVCESCLELCGGGQTPGDFTLCYGQPGEHYARLPTNLKD